MLMEEVKETPTISEKTGYRNPPKEYQFKPGVSGNPSGRPKNTLKNYVRQRFDKMTDDEKEAWLIENKISGIDQWRMGEGNPHQTTDTELKGALKLEFVDSFNKNATPTPPTGQDHTE